jgi:hypothetical protein
MRAHERPTAREDCIPRKALAIMNCRRYHVLERPSCFPSVVTNHFQIVG